MKSGIYIITNKVNGKRYIGSSYDARRRQISHQYRLSKNIHENPHLQNAWNKYGPQSFEFMTVEETPLDCLLKVEQKYLDEAKTKPDEYYNICFDASSNRLGTKHTEESKRLMSEKKKEMWRTASHREKIEGVLKTVSHREKISEALSQRPRFDLSRKTRAVRPSRASVAPARRKRAKASQGFRWTAAQTNTGVSKILDSERMFGSVKISELRSSGIPVPSRFTASFASIVSAFTWRAPARYPGSGWHPGPARSAPARTSAAGSGP